MKTPKRNFLSQFMPAILSNKSIIILLALAIIAQFTSEGLFFNGSNLISILKQNSYICILALGFTAVLSGGNFDLSVGHMLGLLAIIYARLVSVLPASMVVVLTMAAGTILGLLNGLISIKLKLMPFIVTLGMGEIFRGAAYLLCNGSAINVTDPVIKYIGAGSVGSIPINFFLVVILTILMMVMVYRMKLGRYILASGGNSLAAEVSGINTKRVKIITFALCGFMTSISAMIVTGRISVAMPNVGDGLEMDAIAAAVIGGTSLNGGKANVVGAIIGSIILGVINNLLNLSMVSSFWQWVTKGVIIILAILIDAKADALLQKRQKAMN